MYGIGSSGAGRDVVVSTSSGNPFLPVLLYPIVAVGGINNGASTAFTVGELVRQVEDANAKLLLCSLEYEKTTREAVRLCDVSLDRVLVIDSSTPNDRKLLSTESRSNVVHLHNGKVLEWPRITDQRKLESTTSCLLYSFGTTGLPKGVRLSHWNLVALSPCTMVVGERHKARLQRQGRKFRFSTIAHLRMAHIASISWYTLNPFYMGGTCYWMRKYDFESFIEYARQYWPTFQMSVPPIWLQVAKSPKVTNHFDSLEVACSGAAPMGHELAKEVGTKLGKGKTSIAQFWGTTETSGSITGLDWTTKDETGSVGDACANPGEMLVGGPIVSQGYHNRPDATREAFVDGFYRTGGIGLYKNGLVYIVDRKKELIKDKGLQVAPAELEALLISHDKIADLAVICVVEKRLATEVPRAYVVAKDGQRVTGQEVVAFVKASLASHKQLRGGVLFVDQIPKSPSGKILRKELRIRAASETPKAML